MMSWLSWWVLDHDELTVLVGTWSWWVHCPGAHGHLVMMNWLSWWALCQDELTLLVGTWSRWVHWPGGHLVMMSSPNMCMRILTPMLDQDSSVWSHLHVLETWGCPGVYLVTMSTLSWWVIKLCLVILFLDDLKLFYDRTLFNISVFILSLLNIHILVRPVLVRPGSPTLWYAILYPGSHMLWWLLCYTLSWQSYTVICYTPFWSYTVVYYSSW